MVNIVKYVDITSPSSSGTGEGDSGCLSCFQEAGIILPQLPTIDELDNEDLFLIARGGNAFSASAALLPQIQGAVVSVNTCASLSSLPAAAYQTVYAKGLSAIGDRKGGEFIAFEGDYTADGKVVFASATEGVYWIRQDFINIRPKARDIRALAAPALNFAGLPKKVLLQKLRNDFYEFCVYTPINDIKYTRWLITPRFNLNVNGLPGTGGGAPRAILGTLALLYASETIPHVESNKATGTTATPPTVTKTSADGVNTGLSWTAPATVGTVTDVSYCTTIGDKKVYEITGVNRIVMRGLCLANGGIANIKVFTDVGLTTQIDEAQYETPTGRLFNFANGSNGLILVPQAKDLVESSTYWIAIESDATNTDPINNRIYQAGIFGYADIAYDDVGINGLVDDAIIDGVEFSRSYYPGCVAIYLLENATRADWKYATTASGGIATIKAFDVDGNEITGYENSVIDTYEASDSTVRQITIFKGKPLGNYYLMVIDGKTKNASATGYRYYDGGFVAFNENEPGDPEFDDFDNLDVPNNVTDPNNDTGAGSRYVLVGTGNLEQATYVRKTNQAQGTDIFVGGIHGFETNPTPTFYADGVEIDFDGAAQFDKFVATEFVIEFDTNLKFPIDGTSFCDVNYSMNFSQCTYSVEVGKNTLANAIIRNDYSLMLNCPNRNPGDYFTQGELVGGGFDYVAADKNYLLTTYNETGPSIPADQKSFAFINDEYMVVADIVYEDYPSIFSFTPFERGSDLSLTQSRPKLTKVYNNSWGGDYINGTLVPAGTSWRQRKRYSIVEGYYKSLF